MLRRLREQLALRLAPWLLDPVEVERRRYPLVTVVQSGTDEASVRRDIAREVISALGKQTRRPVKVVKRG